jgi:DNA/RNA endonuclease YhcR with UshA esterase domain
MNRLRMPVLIIALAALFFLAFLSPKQIQPYQIESRNIGQQVTFSGIALASRQIQNATIVTLYNYSTIDVLIPKQDVLPGDHVSAKGKVAVYRGELEVIAEYADISEPQAQEMQIGGITDRMAHRTVRAIGEIREKKANTFKIADATGEIYVFAASENPEGAVVEIEGLVERYKSVLYISPRQAARLS